MADLIPTDRELEALKVLWDRENATVREVWQVLSAADRDLAYTTALSLMQVMEQKGLVGHRVDGKTYVYFSRVERASVLHTQRLMETLVLTTAMTLSGLLAIGSTRAVLGVLLFALTRDAAGR